MREANLGADRQGGNISVADLLKRGRSFVDIALSESYRGGVALGEIDDCCEGDLRMGEGAREEKHSETEEGVRMAVSYPTLSAFFLRKTAQRMGRPAIWGEEPAQWLGASRDVQRCRHREAGGSVIPLRACSRGRGRVRHRVRELRRMSRRVGLRGEPDADER